jgi:hypothetical protein
MRVAFGLKAHSGWSAVVVAQVHQEHTPARHHVSRELSYPKWVPAEVVEEAQHLSEQEACSVLGPWAMLPDKAVKPT